MHFILFSQAIDTSSLLPLSHVFLEFPKLTLSSHQFNNQTSLHFITRHRIAHAFAPGTTITFPELAAKTSVPLHDLKRLIRHAISHSRIFSEPTKNTIAHTTSSALLANPAADTSVWADMILHEFWPAAVNTVAAMDKWPGSQEPVHTGLSISLGEEKHLFEVVTSTPERAKRFGGAMAGLSTGEGFEIGHLVRGYDWGRVEALPGGGVVVDVGGSMGHACAAIGEMFSGLRFVVQDLGKTFQGFDPVALLPEAVKGRVAFEAHDFFAPQTVRGDVYLIRWCLHNWSDKYAVKILKALVPKLEKGARVVVNDGVLPEPQGLGASWQSSKSLTDASVAEEEGVEEGEDGGGEVNSDWVDEKSMRSMDLIMLEGLNARERDVDEWRELFKEADERFIWKGAWRPEGSKMWIIEAEWAG